MSTHKEHSRMQETQIRKHPNANRHTHTNPCSPEQTHSQVSVHTQQCTFCPSVGPSITNYDCRVLGLPLPPPRPPRITTQPMSRCQLMHTELHCSEVGACHSSRAQYRVYRHACTCQPSAAARRGRRGGEGQRAKESEQ